MTADPIDGKDRRDLPRLVSVIIPVRNGGRTLGDALEALTRQTYEHAWEVVVADNGSTDDTRKVCAAWATRLPAFRVADASDRQGSSHARNVGAAAAQGELLAFCDADDVADEHWLDALVEAARNHDLVGGVQDERQLNDEATLSARGERQRPALVRPLGFLPFAPTSNLGVWADVYATVGGLSVAYPQAHDVEFSWRAQLSGFDLGHAADAVMHYRYRSTVRGVAKQAYLAAYDTVQLFRDYRASGARRPSGRAILRRWVASVTHLPLLAVRDQRLGSIRLLAGTAGHVVASIRCGVFFL
jgi:glycosyltransferase involved in cell wall biosynthesis